MPSITLTDPVTGTTVASGLIATNNANLRNLLNAGLDGANLRGNPALVANEIPQWNGTQFIRGPAITTSTIAGGPPGSPKDLDIWIATAVDANRVRWLFQYNAANTEWQFLGGGSVWSTGTVAIPGTSTWTTLLSFTAARAGTYLVSGGFFATCNAGGAGSWLIGAGLGGVIQASTAQMVVVAGNTFTLTSIPWTVTVTAGQVINLMGFANQTSTGPVESLSIVPIRIT